MWFSVALMKFHWSGINWHVLNQSECRNCCLYIIIQKIAPQAKSGNTSKYGFSPDLGGKNGGVLSMLMQVILDSLDSSFARPGSAPIWGGKKGEFRDWTRCPQERYFPSTIPFVIRWWLRITSRPDSTEYSFGILLSFWPAADSFFYLVF